MKVLLIGAGLALLGAAALAAVPPAAPTPVRPVVDTYHGVQVSDPYRWLEDGNSPEVKAWSDAQNVRTRAYLDGLPDRAKIQKALTRLYKATSAYDYSLSPAGARIFAMHNDPAHQQPMLVTLNAAADPKSRRPLIDPNALDAKGSIAIDWFVPSPDGSKVALSLSLNGSEDGVLHVYDAATGRDLGDPIPKVQYPTGGGSLAWTEDGEGFWYTRYPGEDAPEAERHFHQQIYLHRLASDWRADPLVVGERDGLPRNAETFIDNRYGGAQAIASVQRGDGNEWQHFVLKPDGSAVKVADYDDQLVAASLGPDGALYGVSNRGSPNGKVVKLAPADFARGVAAARVIVPEQTAAVVTVDFTRALALTRDKLIVRYIDGGPSLVRMFDHDGGHGQAMPIPPVADVEEVDPLPDGDVLYAVATYLKPRSYQRWSAATGAVRDTGLAVRSPVRTDDLKVVRAFAVSKDGTRVPFTIVHRKGIKLDGSTPVLLYGYGGFGINEAPVFIGAWKRLWLDAGGAYVDANIRGGGEYGEAWHKNGALTKKQNGFDDFAAVGRWLIAHRYTTSSRLVLRGGSNGGLLMGAVLTQHPDLARTVVSEVGLYDMLRSETDPNGQFITSEYGSVKDAAQFKALYAYSPYHHVRAGAAYPAVLMLTGANDGRVNPMHSRKFAAALQAAAGSGRPVLLRTSATSGHGIGSSLDEQIAERSDVLAFMFDQTHTRWRPAAAPVKRKPRR